MSSSVSQWLNQLGLGQYTESFESNAIEWTQVPTLSNDDLKELGVNALGHRKRIRESVDSLVALNSAGNQDQASTAGTQLSGVRGEAERRQLTVMFCDLVGSTELSERLDPEVLRDVIRAYQDACKLAIERYEGYVSKYMGDGVLAYFGYPLAHEDDAERSIRAGFAIIESVDQLELSQDVIPQVRVGIATGPVVVGDIIGEGASLESAVVGKTPNIAARLQGLADPHSIVVSPETHLLTSGHFLFKDMGTQTLRGIDQPVRTWQVQGERNKESRFEARSKQQLTPLVGRDEEMIVLLNRWDEATKGDGQIVLVSGEPGIGKSRLCESLVSEVKDESYFLFRYQCSPHHINSALHPIKYQIQQAISIEASNNSNDKLDKLEEFLNQSTDWSAENTPLIAKLLSLSYGDRYPQLELEIQEQKERTIRAIAQFIEGLSTQHTVIMIFEDLHWVDPSTIELLNMLMEQTQGTAVLMLATYRPEFKSDWVGQAHVTLVSLNRISKQESHTMLCKIAASDSLTESIQNEIMLKTDGVPLFIEEVTRTVLEGKKRSKTDAKDGMPIEVPTTLQDSLVARLDRLIIGKQIAQFGAAVGREFTHEIIETICDLGRLELRSALDELVDTGLLFRQGSGLATRYVFKHALLQDAAYDGLLLADRITLHRRIAETLTVISPDDFPLLAHHWEQAGNFNKAFHYWSKGAERAKKFYDISEAIALYWRALDLIEQQPDTPAMRSLRVTALGSAIGTGVFWRNEAEQKKSFLNVDKAIQFSIDVGDLASAARLEIFKGFHTHNEQLLNQALLHSESSGEPAAIADTASTFSDYLGRVGRYEDSRVYTEQAIDIYGQLGLQVREAKTLIIQGRCYSARAGRIDDALRYTDRAREIAAVIDDVWLKSSLVMECEPCMYKGLWEKTIQIAERELTLPLEIGNWTPVIFCSAWAAIACIKLGRLEDGQQFLDQALESSQKRQSLEFQRTYSHIVLSQMQLALGEPAKALVTARRAVEHANQGGFLLEHGAACRALAEAHRAVSDYTNADNAFRQSLNILRNIQSRPELAQSLLAYGQFKLDQHSDEGIKLLINALNLFQEMKATGWIEETQAALAIGPGNYSHDQPT